uniref:Helicase ATP-binding domain-containing protein n=1 Tax=Panagrolaimus davidi TaxID=227884 RepID=A0A914Q4K5_9BILA
MLRREKKKFVLLCDGFIKTKYPVDVFTGLNGISHIDIVASCKAPCIDMVPSLVTETPFYKKFMSDSNLIWNQKNLEVKAVIVIKAPTGTGKTVAIPYIIVQKVKTSKVLVVLPTKLAVRTVYTWLKEDVHSEIHGAYTRDHFEYIVGKTAILYCTSGIASILLRKKHCNFTHVILDEFHDRTVTHNIILALAYFGGRKVIVTSATIGEETFARLSVYCNGDIEIIELNVIPDYKIVIQSYDFDAYLADKVSSQCPLKFYHNELMDRGIGLIKKLATEHKDGDFIVFVSGLQMMNVMIARLDPFFVEKNVQPVRLHSTVLNPPEALNNDNRKCFFSGNIAQSSTTIKNARFVIDTCLTKTKTSYSVYGIYNLVEEWCDKNSIIHRMGRVGRTSDGFYFFLVDPCHFKYFMQSKEKFLLDGPELEGAAISQIMAGNKVESFSNAFDEAKEMTMPQVYTSLILEGACTKEKVVTEYGALLGLFNMDPKLASLVLHGLFYGCLRKAIFIVAALSGTSNIIAYNRDSDANPMENEKWKGKSSGSEHLILGRLLQDFYFNKHLFTDEKKNGAAEAAKTKFYKGIFQKTECESALKLAEKIFLRCISLGLIDKDASLHDRYARHNENDDLSFNVILAITGAFGSRFVNVYDQLIPGTNYYLHPDTDTGCKILQKKFGIYFNVSSFSDGKMKGPMTFVDPLLFCYFANTGGTFSADCNSGVSGVSAPVPDGAFFVPVENVEAVLEFRKQFFKTFMDFFVSKSFQPQFDMTNLMPYFE